MSLTPHPLLVPRSKTTVELYLYSNGLRGLLCLFNLKLLDTRFTYL
jgi:hypothetical protein